MTSTSPIFQCGPYRLRLVSADKSELKRKTRASESDVLSGEIRIVKGKTSRQQLVLLLRELLICASYGHHGFLANTHKESEELLAHSFGSAVVEIFGHNSSLRAWVEAELHGVSGKGAADEDSLFILGRPVELKVERLGSLWGAFKAGNNPTLWLAPDLRGNHLRVIFFHEVFHAIYNFLSLGGKSDYESATLQAKALIRLFVENPGLWGWLSNGKAWPLLDKKRKLSQADAGLASYSF